MTFTIGVKTIELGGELELNSTETKGSRIMKQCGVQVKTTKGQWRGDDVVNLIKPCVC